jgi:hypothetical protein
MTFGHYVSPLTLAEASFSDLELFVFFVILAGVMAIFSMSMSELITTRMPFNFWKL